MPEFDPKQQAWEDGKADHMRAIIRAAIQVAIARQAQQTATNLQELLIASMELEQRTDLLLETCVAAQVAALAGDN